MSKVMETVATHVNVSDTTVVAIVVSSVAVVNGSLRLILCRNCTANT